MLFPLGKQTSCSSPPHKKKKHNYCNCTLSPKKIFFSSGYFSMLKSTCKNELYRPAIFYLAPPCNHFFVCAPLGLNTFQLNSLFLWLNAFICLAHERFPTSNIILWLFTDQKLKHYPMVVLFFLPQLCHLLLQINGCLFL